VFAVLLKGQARVSWKFGCVFFFSRHFRVDTTIRQRRKAEQTRLTHETPLVRLTGPPASTKMFSSPPLFLSPPSQPARHPASRSSSLVLYLQWRREYSCCGGARRQHSGRTFSTGALPSIPAFPRSHAA